MGLLIAYVGLQKYILKRDSRLDVLTIVQSAISALNLIILLVFFQFENSFAQSC